MAQHCFRILRHSCFLFLVNTVKQILSIRCHSPGHSQIWQYIDADVKDTKYKCDVALLSLLSALWSLISCLIRSIKFSLYGVITLVKFFQHIKPRG